MDALVDLTGGLAERFDLAEHDQSYLFRHLNKSTVAGAFITCSRKVGGGVIQGRPTGQKGRGRELTTTAQCAG